MKALSILYHDVIDGDDFDSSGFPGPAAERYKLSAADFEKHLDAISRVLSSAPAIVSELSANESASKVLLTFDDGGASSPRIADMLEKRDWRGHFFITTDYIGKPNFVSAQGIRDLRQRGHVIGSHSCSHPRRMSALSSEQMFDEWRRSTEVLAQLIEEPVIIASVPRGNHSAGVARAAVKAGIKFLFTSEPTWRVNRVEGCWTLGRYGILRGMPASASAGFAAGSFAPCLQQWIAWNLKKVLKNVGGNSYHRLRDLSLGEQAIADRSSGSAK